ncbi:MAG: hypothetical protein BMS9Abin25_0229 [Gammaproteobacteria bacterium]|nr:MAG: hypothetical protein BMS9Abin25_0229 [Gammaproteobacteria bacterium]
MCLFSHDHHAQPNRQCSNPVTSLLILFIDLIRLRRGPQDLPASQNLLIITGFLLIVTAILGDHMNEDFTGKLIFALTQIVILTAIVWGILALNKKSERTVQTLTAFYGTSVLIQLFVWPFRSWLQSMSEETQKQATIPLFAIVVLAIWSFVVMVYIYHNALDCSRGKAILMSILTQLIVGMVMLTLFASELQMEMAK